MSVIVTFTPKVCNVCCSLSAVVFRSRSLSPATFFPACFNKEIGGNTYFFVGGVFFTGAGAGLRTVSFRFDSISLSKPISP